MSSNHEITRRELLQQSAEAIAAAGMLTTMGGSLSAATSQLTSKVSIDFARPDSLFHGDGWESLNPGYWQIKNQMLRRRLTNVGDRARRTGFPFHSATNGGVMKTEYDPSLPVGIIYRNDWKLNGAYRISADFVFHADRPAVKDGDNPDWKMYQAGYGQMGLAFNAKSVFESYNKNRNAFQVVLNDKGELHFLTPPRGNKSKNKAKLRSQQVDAFDLQPGDRVTIAVDVSAPKDNKVKVIGTARCNGRQAQVEGEFPAWMAGGYAGIAARGLIDFSVASFHIAPGKNRPSQTGDIDCYTCYPLGDTLTQTRDGRWTVRFVALLASDGSTVELRIADSESPKNGWQNVPVAGRGEIVNNDWRRNTAVITATLPANPATKTLYYTVWKDGRNVTSDPRIGTASTGPGTGLVGDVPREGSYVGRLPQLTAPYKLCGLSCHAITNGLQQKTDDGLRILGGADVWQFRDQPTVGAYQHLEDYNFQVMVWEDDVWYMELVLYPPSTDDAYKVVKTSICGPTSRWQMMRHWNVINPGDHDYGMDDVKGPEQLAIRRVEGLGQDVTYMRRNFQIVHHLITGDEDVDPLINPKKWRAWKMPARDFTLVILDSRLWRSSQDVDMWDDAGWGAFKSLYDRTDPTRSLLGEEQFGWLQELLATDSSRLICLTGINGMHTIWTGGKGKNPSNDHPMNFSQRDRVTADYAGWVKAGADRVLELLGEREGIVTVYGDVHNGCIMENQEQRVLECSFGPIGRSGGRAVIPGFGPRMRDVDGRPVEIHSLYHKQYADAELTPHQKGDPFYWNFLEMEFDTRPVDPMIRLGVRNMIDAPQDKIRGGNSVARLASDTGRKISSVLPDTTTLANADVRFSTTDGRPVRAIRSLGNGRIPLAGFVDIEPATQLIMTAFDGQKSESQVIRTQKIG